MSEAFEIVIDESRCMGSGNCVFWAPATFDLGDAGYAIVLDAAATERRGCASRPKGVRSGHLVVEGRRRHVPGETEG